MEFFEGRGGFSLYKTVRADGQAVYSFARETAGRIGLQEWYRESEDAWMHISRRLVGACAVCRVEDRIHTPLIPGNAYPGAAADGLHVCGACREPAIWPHDIPQFGSVRLQEAGCGFDPGWYAGAGYGWIDIRDWCIAAAGYDDSRVEYDEDDEAIPTKHDVPLPVPHGDGLLRVHGMFSAWEFVFYTHNPYFWDGFPGYGISPASGKHPLAISGCL